MMMPGIKNKKRDHPSRMRSLIPDIRITDLCAASMSTSFSASSTTMTVSTVSSTAAAVLVQPPQPEIVTPSSASPYACNCNKTCEEITTCEEAQYQLNVCKCNRRDADKDGIACDKEPLNCET